MGILSPTRTHRHTKTFYRLPCARGTLAARENHIRKVTECFSCVSFSNLSGCLRPLLGRTDRPTDTHTQLMGAVASISFPTSRSYSNFTFKFSRNKYATVCARRSLSVYMVLLRGGMRCAAVFRKYILHSSVALVSLSPLSLSVQCCQMVCISCVRVCFSFDFIPKKAKKKKKNRKQILHRFHFLRCCRRRRCAEFSAISIASL